LTKPIYRTACCLVRKLIWLILSLAAATAVGLADRMDGGPSLKVTAGGDRLPIERFVLEASGARS
jgi:hypothetical protein